MMLPNEDAGWVGEELGRRFGLPLWQFSLTATDANRWAIRLGPPDHRRPKILVHNWCYHGSVDETFIALDQNGKVVRPGNIGPPVDPAETTRVVEINDVEALERELAIGDVACVLAEPALTNIGIVLPDPSYHDALRAPHPRAWVPADHRRDAHDLRRARAVHEGTRARSRHAHDREADRRRHPDRHLRVHARGRRGNTAHDRGGALATSAGSAAPWPATRSPSRPRGRAWAR